MSHNSRGIVHTDISTEIIKLTQGCSNLTRMSDLNSEQENKQGSLINNEYKHATLNDTNSPTTKTINGKNIMNQSNVNFKQYEIEHTMENTINQINHSNNTALPLSKRISSIFNEFAIGMKLAQRHNNNQSFDINILATHNIRLLHKRLQQTTEYSELIEKIKQNNNHSHQLWQSLYKENEITCGFITMQANQNLPCYNHPGMNSLFLVLSGQIHLKEYTLTQNTTDDSNTIENNSANHTDKKINMKELASQVLPEGAAVYFQASANTLASLSTDENVCLLLNIQLSSNSNIH